MTALPTMSCTGGISRMPRYGLVLTTFVVLILVSLSLMQVSNVDVTNTYHHFTGSSSTTDWTGLKAKYNHLRDDKFTFVPSPRNPISILTMSISIALLTYKRPDALEEVLNQLLSDEIPSLLEVVVVWNDIDEVPPEPFVSRHGVPVRYRVSTENSLNQKLQVDSSYQTKAILLSDDDVYLQPHDLEQTFQMWREFGQNRLTGPVVRRADLEDDGWHYRFMSIFPKSKRPYNMVLTDLCFAHIGFLDYYSSSDPTMTQIREYVDEKLNCEDIALNFVSSMLTGEGPLQVHGDSDFEEVYHDGGISQTAGHHRKRVECLGDFTDIFGRMPLVNVNAHLQIGGLRLAPIFLDEP